MPRQSSATALLILCALSVGSCERERSNPLDPEGEVVLNRPSAPSGLTAQAGVGFIALSWQPVTSSDLAGYAIYKASQSDGDYKFMTGSGDGTAPDSASTFTTGKTTYVDSVDGAVTLFYRVAAVDTSGFSSELSRFVGATSLADQLPPEAPLALSAIPDEVEPGRVVLSWSPPRHDEDGGELSGLSGYIVLRAESGSGSPVPIDTLVASQTGYTDVGLKSLTTYSYTVIAFDNKGNSSRSAAAVQVTTGGLAAPGGVAAVGGIGRVVVSWDAVEGGELQGYNVYRSDRSDGAYVLLSAEGSGFTTGRTSYEDNAVVAGQVYFYRLEAIGANGLVSERTVFVSAEVEVDEVPPAAPLNVSAVADEAEFGRVVVTWSVPQADSDRGELTGLSGYAVFRSEETTDSFVRVGETTVAQFEDSGLSESTTYFYTVVAIDDAGNESGRSLSVRVKTRGPDLTAPAAPVNVSVVADEVEFGRVVVTWSVPQIDSDGGELTGLSGYSVFRSEETTDSFARVGETTEAQFADTGLSESTLYFYSVAAIDDDGNESGRSRVVSVTTRGQDLTAPATPANVSVSTDETDATRVTVRWNASVRDSDGGALTGLSGYVVLRSEGGGGFAAIDTVGADVREYEDTGLEPLTSYRYTVTAFDEAGNSSSQATSVQATTGGLAVPGRVAAVGGIGRVVVSWDAVEGGELQGYNVYRSDRSDGAYVLLSAEGSGFTTGRTSYEDTAVVAGQVYFYRLEAVGASGLVSEQSIFVSAEVEADEVPPAAPVNVSVVADEVEFGRVVVTWSVPQIDSDGGELTGLSGYAVFRSEETTDSFARVGETTEAQFADTGLSESTLYFYSVAAIDDDGNESGRSRVVSVTTRGQDLTAPATPANVSVSTDETDATRVTVRWNASVRDSDGGALTGLSGYVVLRSEEGGGFATIDTVGADVREYEDTGLEPLTSYRYTVTAFDEAGNSSSQATSVQATTGGLAVPGRVAAAGGIGRVVVSWDAVEGGELQGYNVYRSDRSDGAYVLLSAEGSGFTTGRTSYEDTAVVAGQVYFYRVEAVGASGLVSEQSIFVSAEVDADEVPPAAPANVSVAADETEPTRVTVRWNASLRDSDGGALTGLSGYVLLRSDAGGGFAVIDTVAADVGEYDDTGLEPLTSYQYTVTAFDEAGNSSSQAISVQVTTGGLAVPSGVVAVGGIGRVVVSWGAVSGAELQGYNVYRSDRSDGTYVLLTGGEGSGFTTGRTSYVDSAVVVGQVYFYRVEAVGASSAVSEQSIFVSAEVEVDEVSPAAPRDLLAFADDAAATITLSWSGTSLDSDGGELTGLSSYVVFRSRDTATTLVAVDTLDATLLQFVDSGLASSTTYFYALSALDADGNASPLSASVSATTAGIAIPSGVNAEGGIKRIDLSWNASADDGLQGYNVYRSTQSDQGYSRLAGVEGSSFTTGQTTYIDSGLTGGGIFFYQVTTVTNSGESARSAFTGATVSSDIRAPAAPTFLDGEPVTGDPAALSLEWKAPTTDVGGAELTGLANYLIYRGDSSTGPFTQIGSSTTTSFQDDELDATTTYFYEVEALDDEGNASPRSSTISLTTEGVDVPKNVRLSATTPSDSGEDPIVTISWDASVGAVLRYEVQRTQVEGSENDADFTEVLPTGVATTRTDSGVTRGETYYYRVRMVDSQFRESVWTALAEVTVSN